MMVSKMKFLPVAVFCLVAVLWPEVQCMEDCDGREDIRAHIDTRITNRTPAPRIEPEEGIEHPQIAINLWNDTEGLTIHRGIKSSIWASLAWILVAEHLILDQRLAVLAAMVVLFPVAAFVYEGSLVDDRTALEAATIRMMVMVLWWIAEYYAIEQRVDDCSEITRIMHRWL